MFKDTGVHRLYVVQVMCSFKFCSRTWWVRVRVRVRARITVRVEVLGLRVRIVVAEYSCCICHIPALFVFVSMCSHISYLSARSFFVHLCLSRINCRK
jgi:hypothetical protein